MAEERITEEQAEERVGDMTRKELNEIIKLAVVRHISQNPITKPGDERTMAEINESIRRHRITTPLGGKSPREMLREDRNR